MHALTEKHEEIQEVFDKAPTRASWDIPGGTCKYDLLLIIKKQNSML